MNNKKIDEFLKFCKGNDKTAIIDKKRKVSFGRFYEDCLKMKAFLGKKLPRGEKAILFVYPYSYLFYILIFGGIMVGANLVIIDSFADKERVKKLAESVGCGYALTGGITRFLGFKLSKLKKINVDKFGLYEKSSAECGNASVTTFTSGTTGFPKAVERSADFLLDQAEFIRKNITLEEKEVVFCGLPMYSVLSVFSGYTTVISGKLNPKVMKVTAVITSIKKALSFPVCRSVKNGFLGGAILYGEEADKISSVFPCARITYVYGATESALMYKTTLDKYREDLFSFDEKIEGVSIGIENENCEGVGEISAKGDIVIAGGKHFTGDIGKISGGKLYVYGRKKYSMPEIGFYNYAADEKIREDNENLKAAFSFAMKGKVYVVYKGDLTVKNPDYIYFKLRKIPYDAKHKTKLDYKKAASLIGVYRES